MPETALDLAVIGASVSRPNTSPQACGSSTGWGVTISWTTEAFDTGGMWDAGDPTKLTAQRSGLYVVNLSGSFVANATGDRQARILLNGATELAQVQGRAPGTFYWTGFVATVVSMQVGDYVEAQMGQNSGGNLNTANCFFSALGFGQA